MSFDVLQEKIREKANPTVAGLDARVEYIPPHILKKHTDRLGETLEAAAEAVAEFDCGLIDALCDVVPAVKPQAAYFEMLGWRGMKVMEDVIAYAKSKGLYVIADIKRGDIGTTATAYAEGWLGTTQVGSTNLSAFDADCVTLNGYMGSDAIKPFLKECVARNKSAFVLAKTSNPSSVELQDMVAGDRVVYTVMGDRIVAATYLAAAASAGGEIQLTGVDWRHLSTVTAVLREAGCAVESRAASIRLGCRGPLRGVPPVRTAPYPGFPTDAQAPLMAVMARSSGCTVFVENIFESRYRHVDELTRMGADIRVEGRVAVVYGVPRLHGAKVQAADLRGGAALVVAALGAEGRTSVSGVHHMDRGYQSLEGDLSALGASIRRI